MAAGDPTYARSKFTAPGNPRSYPKGKMNDTMPTKGEKMGSGFSKADPTPEPQKSPGNPAGDSYYKGYAAKATRHDAGNRK